jgi:hypothetical protein
MRFQIITSSLLLIFVTYFSVHHIIKCKIYRKKVIETQRNILEEDEKYRIIVSDMLKANDLEELEKYALDNGFINMQKKDCIII